MALMLGGLTMLVAGCSDNYYRVTDPSSGKTYYTTKVEDTGRGGGVKINDAKTQSVVTLQSSEVKKIAEDEYQDGLVAKEPAKPASIQPASLQPAVVQPAAAPSAQPAVK